MRYCITRSSSLAVLRRIFASCLLVTSVALPLSAWAVDTDGDGVDDSTDAFPNNAEATIDSDLDGAPDFINSSRLPVMFSDAFDGTAFQSGWSGGAGSWSVSGGYAKYRYYGSMRIGRTFDLPSGGVLSFRHQRLTTGDVSGYLRVNSVTTNTLFTSTSWVQTTVNLPVGSNLVDWTGSCTGNSLGCTLSATVQFDDVVLKASSFTVDKFPNNSASSVDSDSDGSPDSWNAACDVTCQANSGLVIDNCPDNANADQLNTDGDSQGNVCDTDDDNDGVADGSDACKLDATASTDNTDGDSLCNLSDPDDDNDGVLDGADNCPLNANADQLNTDGDAQGNVCDTDDDNDGVVDATDEWPVDSRYTTDTDRDTLPDNWEVDHGRDPAVADYAINNGCEKNELGGVCSPGGMTSHYQLIEHTLCSFPGEFYLYEKYTPTSAGVVVTKVKYFCSGGSYESTFPLRTIAADHLVQVFYIIDISPSNSKVCFLDRQGKHCANFGSSISSNENMEIDSDRDGVLRHNDPDDLDILNPVVDADSDGSNNDVDNCVLVANTDQLNTDGDTQGNICDVDDDNDGVLDVNDAFPLDDSEYVDTDSDGIGDNADTTPYGTTDSDHDTLPDLWEQANGRDPLRADYMVSAGGFHSCALDNTGVKCWGLNTYGQSAVPSLSNPTAVSAGYRHTCAIDDTGVKCWGKGTTNTGTQDNFGQSIPPTLTNPTSVSAGYWHTCAIDDTGVVCWGKNTKGQANVPTLNNPMQVAAGKNYTCALDGSLSGETGVVCWGINGAGQTNVPSLVNPQSISLSVNHACAVDDTGVVCWGKNNAGQLDVPALVSPQLTAVGATYSCAMDSGSAVCWGDSAFNTVGQTAVPALNNPASLDAGRAHTCALDSSGAKCWGRKAYVKVPVLNFTQP